MRIPFNIADERHRVKLELAAEVLRVSGGLTFKAQGSSMAPSVWPGDIVTIESVAAAELEPGDVALYERPEGVVLHRYMGAGPGGLRFRGDARSIDDAPVQPAQVLGKVIAIRRGRRRLFPARLLNVIARILSPLLRRSPLAWAGAQRLRRLRMRLPGFLARRQGGMA